MKANMFKGVLHPLPGLRILLWNLPDGTAPPNKKDISTKYNS